MSEEQGELFSSPEAQAVVSGGLTDVESERAHERKGKVWVTYSANDTLRTIEKAIAEGRHSLTHQVLCQQCREWVDCYFYATLSQPRKWICIKCAAKQGDETAKAALRKAGESQQAEDTLTPAKPVSTYDPFADLPPQTKEGEQ